MSSRCGLYPRCECPGTTGRMCHRSDLSLEEIVAFNRSLDAKPEPPQMPAPVEEKVETPQAIAEEPKVEQPVPETPKKRRRIRKEPDASSENTDA